MSETASTSDRCPECSKLMVRAWRINVGKEEPLVCCDWCATQHLKAGADRAEGAIEHLMAGMGFVRSGDGWRNVTAAERATMGLPVLSLAVDPEAEARAEKMLAKAEARARRRASKPVKPEQPKPLRRRVLRWIDADGNMQERACLEEPTIGFLDPETGEVFEDPRPKDQR